MMRRFIVRLLALVVFALLSAFGCDGAAPTGGMAYVFAGPFDMGCNESLDTQCENDELPFHRVELSTFYIDRTEVTQAQYDHCVIAGACTVPASGFDPQVRASYPVTDVTFPQAQGYCEWIRKRLPTEAEWEKAARGIDGRIYPWGNQDPTCELAVVAVPAPILDAGLGCGQQLEPVGSRPAGASPYGVLDMSGNAGEFVSDFYDAGYYASSPARDPTGPRMGDRVVWRGGAADTGLIYIRASNRGAAPLDFSWSTVGFRCAK